MRRSFLLPLALSFLAACSSEDKVPERKGPPPAAPAPVDDENEPYNARSNDVAAVVSGHAGNKVLNRAVVAFDERELVSFSRQERADQSRAQGATFVAAKNESSGTTVGTTAQEQLHGQEIASRDVGQKAEARVASRDVSETRTDQSSTGKAAQQGTAAGPGAKQESVAGASAKQESVAGEGAKQESVAGASAKQESVATGERTTATEETIRAEREERLSGTTVKTEIAQQQVSFELSKLEEDYLKTKNSALADMILSDHVLKTYFRSTKEEFYDRVVGMTKPEPNVVLKKSIATKVISPGETFDYELVLRVRGGEPISNIFIFDAFPQGLLYEKDTLRIQFESPDGARRPARPEEMPTNDLLIPNELRRGKIAFHFLKRKLSKGEAIVVTFGATWYYPGRGTVKTDGAHLLEAPNADAPVKTTLAREDLVLVSVARVKNEAEGLDYVQVSARRPGGARVDGFLATGDYQVFRATDDADRERQKAIELKTIFAGLEEREGGK